MTAPPPSADHHKGDGDHLDNLDQMLDHSLEMNKEMEADVDSLLSQELAQIDSKTVEDIFKGVLETTSPSAGKMSSTMSNRAEKYAVRWCHLTHQFIAGGISS